MSNTKKTMALTGKAVDDINIITNLRECTRSQAVIDGVALLSHVLLETEDGAKVVIIEPNGDKKELVII